MMKIKKIITNDNYYSEYIVTDGDYEIVSMCLSTPYPVGYKLECGTTIENMYAFFLNKPVFKKVIVKDEKYLLERALNPLEYKIRGIIVDKFNALVKVHGFYINLSKEIEDGEFDDFNNGDIIEFTADRIDSELKGFPEF